MRNTYVNLTLAEIANKTKHQPLFYFIVTVVIAGSMAQVLFNDSLENTGPKMLVILMSVGLPLYKFIKNLDPKRRVIAVLDEECKYTQNASWYRDLCKTRADTLREKDRTWEQCKYKRIL